MIFSIKFNRYQIPSLEFTNAVTPTHSLRNSSITKISRNIVSHNYERFHINFFAVEIWNNLPLEITNCTNYHIFKSKATAHIISTFNTSELSKFTFGLDKYTNLN